MKLSPNNTKAIQLAIAVAAVLTVLVVSWQYLQPKGRGVTDFAIYYVVGDSVSGSGALSPLQVYQHDKLRAAVLDLYSGAATHYLYPPTALIWFAPFALLPFRLAAKLWGMVNVVLFIGTFYIALVVILKERQWYRWYYSALLLMLCLSAPWLSLLDTGQVNAWIGLGLVLMIVGLQKKWPWLIGISLGSIIALKIFPVIFIPYLLLRKQYRAVLITLGTLLGLTLITLPWFGLANWQEFFMETLPSILKQSGGASGHTSISLYGSLRYSIREGVWDWLNLTKPQLIAWAGTAQLVVAASTGLVLLLYTWLVKQQNWLLEVLLWLIWLFLAAQVVQMQYVLWLIPVLLYVIVKPTTQRYWVITAGSIVLGMILVLFNKSIGLPDLLFGVIKPITLGMLMIMVGLICLLVKPHPPVPPLTGAGKSHS